MAGWIEQEVRSADGPYSAKFFGCWSEDGDGVSSAYGIVEPPFSDAEGLIKSLTVGGVEITPYATTQSKTVLTMVVPLNTERYEDTHERRLELARYSLSEIVSRLNEIETNTFLAE